MTKMKGAFKPPGEYFADSAGRRLASCLSLPSFPSQGTLMAEYIMSFRLAKKQTPLL
jgi:hypothetical protein